MPRAKGKQKNHPKVAEVLNAGASLKDALLAGGYTDTMASRGMATVNQSAPLIRVLTETGQYAGLSAQLNPERIKDFVTGHLVENIADGKDKAPQSLKMLGSIKGVDMFQAEQIIGGMILNVPDDWKHLFSTPNPSSQK
jgi:hypothetical protein